MVTAGGDGAPSSRRSSQRPGQAAARALREPSGFASRLPAPPLGVRVQGVWGPAWTRPPRGFPGALRLAVQEAGSERRRSPGRSEAAAPGRAGHELLPTSRSPAPGAPASSRFPTQEGKRPPPRPRRPGVGSRQVALSRAAVLAERPQWPPGVAARPQIYSQCWNIA